MAEVLVSIIVPVYKVETELGRCIQSILCQTYKNLEIILVDDGSPDNCPELCDRYAKIDSRIRVIHKKNGGLSDARNAGLDIAKGKFLSFIDSDDWVSENFIECLVRNIVETDSDIAICGYAMVHENGRQRHYGTKESREILEHEQAISALFGQLKFGCMICTKIYRAELFEGIRFPKGKIYEDIAVSLPLFDRSKRCVIINDKLYNYFQRKGSIVNSKFDERKLDMLEYVQNMIDYSYRHGHKYDIEAEAFYLKALMANYLQVYNDNNLENKKKWGVYLKNEIKKHKKFIWNNEYIEKVRQYVLYAILCGVPAKILTCLWTLKIKHTFSGVSR